MASPSIVDMVYEVDNAASGASDSNGGGFSVANKGATGTDHSLAAPTTFTSTLSAVGTTTLTDSGAGFNNTMLGNVINISGQGLYCITAYLTTSTVTVDRALGTFATTTGVLGGAFLTYKFGVESLATSNKLYVKYSATPYSPATSVTLAVSGSTSAGENRVVVTGYDTTRTLYNTDANRPTVAAAADSINFFVGTGKNYYVVRNIIFDGNTHASVVGIVGNGSNSFVENCRFTRVSNPYSGATSPIQNCEFDHNTGSISSQCMLSRCYFHDNTGTCCGAITWAASYCIFANNSGASTDAIGGGLRDLIGCTFYNNGRHGVTSMQGGNQVRMSDCLFVSNGGYGVNVGTDSDGGIIINNCAFYGNTSGDVSSSGGRKINCVTLTGDPFTNAAAGDFSLNNAAGAGADCRGIAFEFPGL